MSKEQTTIATSETAKSIELNVVSKCNYIFHSNKPHVPHIQYIKISMYITSQHLQLKSQLLYKYNMAITW